MLRTRARARGGALKKFPINGNSGVIVLFGDSLEQHNGVGSATAGSEEFSNWSRGYYNWCRMLDPRGRWDNWWDTSKASKFFNGQNQGISGNETSQMLARTSDVTNITGARIVIVGGGTNDLNSSVTAATIQSRLESIFTTFRNAGMRIIYLTPPPRPTSGTNSWASGGAIRTEWLSLCSNMQTLADANPSWLQIVRRDLICGNGDADRTPKTGYLQSDNVHLTPIAGYHIAQDSGGVIEKLASWANPFTDFPTTSMTGEMVVNPTLAGTGGLIDSPRVTGVLPDNMRGVRSSGSNITAACSKETISGVEMLKIVITRNGSGTGTETIRIDMNGDISAGLPAAGNWLQGAAKLRWDASPQLNSVTLRARGQPTSPANMDAWAMKTDTGLLWENVNVYGSDNLGVWQFTPKFEIRAGTTAINYNITINVDNRVAGTDTVWISRMHLYPVDNPKTSLGF